MVWVYLLLVILAAVDIWLGIKLFEYIFCASVRGQPPFVPSCKKLQMAVVKEILTHYGTASNVCEIGSGHGGLARYIACQCGVRVTAIENMPFSVLVSKIADVFCMGKCHTVWADAFEWLESVRAPMDIAVAYLGPVSTARLADYSDKFNVLISLDFKIPGMIPVRTIDVGGGYTLYRKQKYPHRLFVYQFK